MRAVVGGVTVALVLLVATAAHAERVDMMTSWAWAWVDNQPFLDPNTGAPLPANSAYPRGQVKDRGTPDGYSVKMTVTALGASGQQLDQYTVADGSAVYRDLERRLNLSAPVMSVRFDLCTVPAAHCVTQTFSRPATSEPTPTPGSGGSGPGASPTPTPQSSPPAAVTATASRTRLTAMTRTLPCFPARASIPATDSTTTAPMATRPRRCPEASSTTGRSARGRIRRSVYAGAPTRCPLARRSRSRVTARRPRPFKLRRRITDQYGEVST